MRTLILKNKIFITILLVGIILRFYRLADFPIHLNPDEITQLYEAISIAQTGKDIYGNFLPFIFPSVGDFKPPFYTYLTSLFYIFFGGGELIIRLPGTIFSVLIIPAIYFFNLKFLKNNTIALASAFFTAISPSEIFFSRKSFENSAGIFFMLIGFLCFFNYFEKKKNLKWLIFSSIIFSFGMYTYFSHAIIIPLLITIFIFIYRRHFSSEISQYLVPIGLFIILVSPLIFMIITNPGVRYRSKTVFVSQDRTLGHLLELGKSSNQISNFLVQKYITLDYISDRYLKQFDPKYLFATGLDLTNQGLLDLGPLLLVQAPFLLLGIIYLMKRENANEGKKFMAAWILLGMLPSALTFENHSPHRVVMVFTMLNVVCGAGFYFFLKLMGKYKKFFYLSLAIIFVAFFLNITYFLHIYFVNYPFEKSEYLQYPFKQIAEFAWSQYSNFESIVFDPQFGGVAPMIGVGGHYYLAYYGHYPPDKFQREFHKGSNPREVVFDKFSIRQVYWPKDRDQKNSLFIVSVWSVPLDDVDPNSIIKRFNFYNGKLAFYAIKL